MGSWDCYCALCSGPLGKSFIRMGSKKADNLRERHKTIQAEKRMLKRRKAGDNTPHEEVDNEVDMDDGEDYGKQMEALAKSNWEKSTEESNNKDEDDDDDDDDDDDEDYEQSSTSTSTVSTGDSVVDSDDGNDSDLFTGNISDVQIPAESETEHESEHDDSWSQSSELSYSGHDYLYRTDETDQSSSSTSVNEYDPSILNPSIIQWIDRCRALAYNEDASGTTKAYITGRGRYDDYGSFDVKLPGHDPNDVGPNSLTCYYAFDNSELPAFPFHEACFCVLARSLGYTDPKMVSKDLLYKVMSQNVRGFGGNLTLEYGTIPEGLGEQFWASVPGEEFVVCDPGFKPDFDQILQSILPVELFNDSSELADLSPKVRNDPWTTIPYDLLIDVVSYLSVEDATSLMTASWHVFASTRDGAFWKHLLRTRLSAWFWEVPHFLTTTTFPVTFNFKRLFLWLDSATIPEFGARGPLVGIANRRRIWGICQQLVPSYLDQMKSDRWVEVDDDEAHGLLEGAISVYTPVVLNPQPRDARPISAQFIRSWPEITNRSCAMCVYWNNEWKLIGISMTFGTTERVFGSTNGQTRAHSMYIPANDWIRRLIVYFDDRDVFPERPRDGEASTAAPIANEVFIVAIEVVLISGKTKYFEGSTHHRGTHRPFAVLPDMALIGLTGETSENGVISRLGLLQAAPPGSSRRSDNVLPIYPHAETLLWSPPAMRFKTAVYGITNKIWSHPTYKLHGFPKADHGNQILSDMLLHELFLWSETPEEDKKLTRIMGMQVIAGYGGPSRTGAATYPIYELRGLKRQTSEKPFSFLLDLGVICVPDKHPGWNLGEEPPEREPARIYESFEDATTSRFEIDGVGGEIISEVHFSSAFGTLKLVTSWGRDHIFGDAEKDCEHVKRAEPGERIIGLSCCFRGLGGPGWGRLLDVGVVTRRVEEGEETMDVNDV